MADDQVEPWEFNRKIICADSLGSSSILTISRSPPPPPYLMMR